MNAGRRPFGVRLYAALLGLLPESRLGRHRADAAELFEDLYREQRAVSGRLGEIRLVLNSAMRLLACAFTADTARPKQRTEARGQTMRGMVQDIRLAMRATAKRPGFAATTILILAVGIGATATIFSVVDTVVLRSMPYPDAGQLVHFDEGAHSFPSFESWRDLSSFETIAAAWDQQVDLTGDGSPERLPAAKVSGDFFRLLGAAPRLGRLFDAGDYPGDGSITVLSHGAWLRRWGGDPRIIGTTLQVNGAPTVVVGVLSGSFEPPAIETGSRVDLWFPLDDGGDEADEHGFHVLGIVGRLNEGRSLAAAQAEIDAQRTAVSEEFPQLYRRRDGELRMIPLVPLREATVREVSSTLYILLGAVGLMLLIACANVANLFLARGTTRSRELALRSALGAGRTRLMALVLTESLLLALLGGALGVAIAYGGVELFTRFDPGGIPRIQTLEMDVRVLGFAVLASVATGVLFGTLPAVQASRAQVGEVLKDGAASVTTGRGGRRTRNALVVTEISLAMVLLVGAGLLFRTLVAMTSVEPGFRSESLAVLPLSLDATYGEGERLAFVRSLVEGIEALPGTDRVSAGWTVPFTYTGRSRCCWRTNVVGDPALADEDNPFVSTVHPVTPGYFTTLEAEVIAGRDFGRADGDSGALTAIINVPAAETLFGTESAVGRSLTVGDEVLTVVGVVAGVRHWGLHQDIEEAVYVPYARFGADVPFLNVLVRSETPAGSLPEALRQVVWSLDPDLPVDVISTMEQRIAGSVATPRFMSLLFAAFAGVALILACAGIYGSMLYTVNQRRREMGIRLALGAGGGTVTRMILRNGLWVSGLGIALGALAALGASGLLGRLVWGIEPTDPITFVAVAVVLGGTGALASLLPALQAARTDPIETLRAE